MCIDFTNLNDACLKDCSPFPKIGTLINVIARNEMPLHGYSQIRMYKDDVSKVSFITDFGVFYYLVIAFGLKNKEATC